MHVDIDITFTTKFYIKEGGFLRLSSPQSQNGHGSRAKQQGNKTNVFEAMIWGHQLVVKKIKGY